MPIIPLLFLFLHTAQAEPWLSNRVTKNCTSCHSPGRINRPAKERRCTLSCQGCHVNPNGGGLRNHYGKWQQGRWLRSLTLKGWRQKNPPASVEHQKYSQLLDRWLDQEKSGKETQKRIRSSDLILRESAQAFPDSRKYNEHHSYRSREIANSASYFLSQVPKEDPYYLERSSEVLGGGDIRLMNVSIDRGTGEDRENFTWAMAADLGVRWKPVKSHFSLVMEARFLNGPQNSGLDKVFSEAQVRSGYLLIDDLMFNSHFMLGLYRPMFGHYNPDHESLMADLTGLDQRAVFRAVGFGTAPNVPFFNIHWLDPGDNSTASREKGAVATLGARFVTLGLSATLSYWNTEDQDSQLTRKMYSLTVGGKIWRIISILEYLSVEKEFATGSFDKGAALWSENKLRLWREIYLAFNYGRSNVARTLKEGSGQEIAVGFKSFLLNNTELEFLYIQRDDTVGGNEISSDLLQTQLHLFF